MSSAGSYGLVRGAMASLKRKKNVKGKKGVRVWPCDPACGINLDNDTLVSQWQAFSRLPHRAPSLIPLVVA
jgi:hypothetical protein